MVRVLPFIVELVLVVYCLIDLWQADRERVRLLPKPVWVLLILVIPLIGGVAWLLAGRPEAMGRDGAGRRGPQPPRGPDDDPDFLRGL
ncbi:PLD nuclease N-terminal domain-containing protein [Angustibacter sp. Root456]|uniref:PLD nuclease N-terminal domain-containing protein n=1 Tax=Angustibacter sp. Root456 TaxID=1736539 RepID=UPI00070008CE|nr:PLD nuclease N-terminal domain-containing protein [Angustibacter sp. Root456]KQX61616.1 hypothetical protein ASD06_13455 [Angustibacter sp. Root456]